MCTPIMTTQSAPGGTNCTAVRTLVTRMAHMSSLDVILDITLLALVTTIRALPLVGYNVDQSIRYLGFQFQGF